MHVSYDKSISIHASMSFDKAKVNNSQIKVTIKMIDPSNLELTIVVQHSATSLKLTYFWDYFCWWNIRYK